MDPSFVMCGMCRKNTDRIDYFPNYFQNKVYYTFCVESVETCSGHFSPVFSRSTCYGMGKADKEVSIMLGERIAALRRQAGLSQAELAQRLQISASAMGMYEQGRREPSVDTLVALARELQVSTDFLLTGRVRTLQEDELMTRMLLGSVDAAEQMLTQHPQGGLTRQELTVLLAALLMDA